MYHHWFSSNRQYWHVWRRLLWPADIAIRYAVDDFEQMENKPDLWMYCAETGYRMTTKMSEDNPVDTLEQIIQSTRISYTTGRPKRCQYFVYTSLILVDASFISLNLDEVV